MITLALDTSFHFLTLVLYHEDQVVASIQKEAFKQQSETILDEIDALFKSAKLDPKDLNQIVLTHGPGSYTGLRIAMTIAKILGSVGHLKVFTLSSLQVLVGLKENVCVLIDARAQRVYFASYHLGDVRVEDCVIPLEEAKSYINPNDQIIGEGHLLNQMDFWPDYTSHFMALKSHWIPVEEIHTLVPKYLKEHAAVVK